VTITAIPLPTSTSLFVEDGGADLAQALPATITVIPLPTSTSLLVEDGGAELAQALPATTAIPLPTSTSLLVEDGDDDNQETGHEDPVTKNQSSWKRDRFNVRREWIPTDDHLRRWYQP
jgi:hypothetical protein